MDEKSKSGILQRGMDCFNRQEFFECHEVLEELWLREAPAEKPFYQGIIQVASAFHHFKSGNLQGAYSLLQRGSRKLQQYLPSHLGIDLDALLGTLAAWEESLGQGEPLQDSALPEIRTTP